MGCDIHLMVEARKPGASYQTNVVGFPDGPFQERPWSEVPEIRYRGRNYNLFAMLADVRNGYGFAGCPTGQGFIPISAPKGMPPEPSWDYESYAKSWEGDGHSHSWLTLRELLAYNWNQTTTLFGVVTMKEFLDWNGYRREQGDAPKDYAGDVWGQGIKTLTMEEGELAHETLKAYPEYQGNIYWAGEKNQALVERVYPKTYVRARWEETYSKSVSEFFQAVVFPMLEYVGGVNGDLDSIRICFFFDN